jgi:aryl-phospho-beta-D-glucosidase BglC (GH1 family)
LIDAASNRRDVLIQQIARLEHHGLAVVIALHPQAWHLESSTTNQAALFHFWQELAPRLQFLDPRLTYPELLNEPVFPGQAEKWAQLQENLRAAVRSALPNDTIVLTGNDWGSIAGLEALQPSADPNVIYSFHFYDPVELTSLAAWRHDVDTTTLARLPFPAPDPAACNAIAKTSQGTTGDVIRFYCSQQWDSTAISDRIGAAYAWAQQHHAAILAGEFGATSRLNPAARLAWLQTVWRACETHAIGWALWGYDDVMGFDLPHPPGQRPMLNSMVLRALGLGTDERQFESGGIPDNTDPTLFQR